jgi:uncharacterized repeat protein (TIGR01451 family)
VSAPVLGITKTHTGNFTVGQTGDYTITVSNAGALPTVGTVTVNDFLPFGMTATAINATGWTCSQLPTTFVNCTRADVLAVAASYPAITVTVSIDSNVSANVTNSANVTGGGDLSTHFANDFTTINVPDLAITKTHSGDFFAGQTGAVYTLTVSNVGTVATAGGNISLNDFLPTGLISTTVSGTGWTCSTGQFVYWRRGAAIPPSWSQSTWPRMRHLPSSIQQASQELEMRILATTTRLIPPISCALLSRRIQHPASP